MNEFQKVWWQQASSDWDIFLLLRRESAASCHMLHYLQMATEKLGKAYFWQSNKPPKKSHAGFPKFIRSLGAVPADSQPRVAALLGFRRFEDFQHWSNKVLPIAYDLERLAPALALNGPNPEYPWPQEAPQYAPASYKFDVWTKFTETGHGRQFMRVVDSAMKNFPQLD